jgi:hypothetical protein
MIGLIDACQTSTLIHQIKHVGDNYNVFGNFGVCLDYCPVS